jgi:hypothetical protein
MLDALARMEEPEMKLAWPREEKPQALPPASRAQNTATAWMA